MIRKYVTGLDAGLAFLTRLRPGRHLESSEFASCIAPLPLVGLVLGAIAAGPFWMGLFSDSPWVQGWLVLLIGLYLTRGLHLDGLADVADGMGAHLDPERFWTIVKDSRTGVFGATAAALAVVGLTVCFGELFSRGMYGAVVFSFVMGRTAIGLLSFSCRELTRPGLGGLFIRGATPWATIAALGMSVLIGLLLVPVRKLISGYVLLFLMVNFLSRTARKVSGINGDFLGASVVAGELSACLGCLLIP